MNPLVSIIMPSYNAAKFLPETLQSIFRQSLSEFEIILIDDGSTDHTKEMIKSISDARLHYYYQVNQGVSAARNHGFEKCRGAFTVFFDADDLMSDEFLMARYLHLLNHSELDFVCGEVKNFSETGFAGGAYRGTSSDTFNEVLFYYPMVTTCPSNYMFRREFLITNNLRFHADLSSTADKLFILQCARAGRSSLIKNEGKLLYRVSETSMSHQLTEKLVQDNEMYYRLLAKLNLIPPIMKPRALFTGYMILFASWWKVGRIQKSLFYGIKAFFISPLRFVKRIADR